MMHLSPQKCAHKALSIIVVTLAFVCIVVVGTASALMPPHVYAQASSESQVKAIATIKEVQIDQVGKRATTKTAVFQLEYALTPDTAGVFSGTCLSVDTAAQEANMLVGGDTYFYPHVGDRVFVTISEDGGDITSMTPMTYELEKVIREEPARLEYGVTKVRIKPRKGKGHKSIKRPPHSWNKGMPKPMLKGKAPRPHDSMSVFDEPRHIDGAYVQPPRQSRNDLQGQLLLTLGDDDVGAARRLLGQGANPNIAIAATGQTPVMAAESVRMAKLLVERGADPKGTDFEGGSALHYAVTRSKAPGLIRYFTDKGVDPNLRGWKNEPAIFVAADFFHETRAFEKEYDVVGESDLDGPQNEASGASPRKVLQALIDAGADINARDEHGNTLLMNATVQDNADMVKLLLDLGADKSIALNNGTTAKDFADELGHRYIYQMLDEREPASRVAGFIGQEI